MQRTRAFIPWVLLDASLILACTDDTVLVVSDAGTSIGDGDGEPGDGDPGDGDGDGDGDGEPGDGDGDSGDGDGDCTIGDPECPCEFDGDCESGHSCIEGACVEDPPAPVCGDGMLDLNEECDAGANNGPGQACLADCTINVCGDGDPGPGEGCDDGNAIDDDECSNACVAASCGDGVTQATEDCDDGNGIDDDGCTNACTNPSCGDAIIQANEDCDDGPSNSDLGDCTSACLLAICGDGLLHSEGMGGEQCDAGGNNGPGQACLDGCILNVCGDADLGPGEGCDDGNLVPGDGCNEQCVLESCGNGVVDVGEACDDGNGVDEDDCTSACALPACGDGFVQMGEQCDLGLQNANTGDCTSVCELPVCGDGLLWAGHEQCDEGQNNANDGDCKLDCTNQICGDGFVGPGEGCDDANLVNDDGCTNACKLPTCGDGILQMGEQCDEGLNNGNGGCTLMCTFPPCPCGWYHDSPQTCADEFPNVIFVNPAVQFPGLGECWAEAVPTLADAIQLANPGDQLWVAAGTYVPPGLVADRTRSWVLPSGVSLYGGFVGNESTLNQRNWDANQTVLSGDIDGNGFSGNQATGNSYHVLEIPAGDGVVVDGVTIRGGYANGVDEDSRGGGAYVFAGNPSFVQTNFRYNYSNYPGEGLFAAGGATSLTSCDFSNHDCLLGSISGALTVGAGASVSMNGGVFSTNDWRGWARVEAGGSATLESITGSSQLDNIVVLGDLTLIDSNIAGSRIGVDVLPGGSLSTIGGHIDDMLGGHGIRLDQATGVIDGTHFDFNRAISGPNHDRGGAISATSTTLTITDALFTNNQASVLGSAIFTDQGPLTIDNTTFSGNNGAEAVVVYSNTTIVTNSVFNDNEGGIQVRWGDLVVDDSVFHQNFDSSIRNDGASCVVRDSLFEENTAVTGGGIFSTSNLDVANCTFIANDASSGAGIYHSSLNSPTVRIHSSLFFGNFASNAGGAVRLDRHPAEIANSVFSANQTNGIGGAVLLYQSDVEIHDSSFVGNVSIPDQGGAIGSVLASVAVFNSVFWGDSTVLYEDAALSSDFYYVCAPGVLAGVDNVVIGGDPYVDADGVDDLPGTMDDELHLAGGMCLEPGDAGLRPADGVDLDDDNDVIELLPLDLDGGPRVANGQMERGAFEF